MLLRLREPVPLADTFQRAPDAGPQPRIRSDFQLRSAKISAHSFPPHESRTLRGNQGNSRARLHKALSRAATGNTSNTSRTRSIFLLYRIAHTRPDPAWSPPALGDANLNFMASARLRQATFGATLRCERGTRHSRRAWPGSLSSRKRARRHAPHKHYCVLER